ncbi:uncharacterized protein LOC108864886 [Galendromus occidentalis]|uniref:Uncharacterized protein LOC108864886 n=1 Tax=Galendromus occidentalis TaxID=34638 RepID=A0AAJ7L848_9ACAR|nr:uncharacterized protein LOC108864886 [Galendromus occidentalis]
MTSVIPAAFFVAALQVIEASVTCQEKLFDDDERSSYPNHTQFRYYHCPGRFPSNHTLCCDLDQQKCCPPLRHFYEIDKTWAVVISVTVSVLCLLIGITCLVCCFWRRCPLWTCCRPQPKHDVAFSDQYEEVPVLPPEEKSKKSKAPLASLASTNASQDNLDA